MAANQPDVLGVYRMVDSYDNRPVYKQDGGENYIYYRCLQHDSHSAFNNNHYQCCFASLVRWHSGWPPVRLAQERVPGGFSCAMGA